jgi:hypothetical protein
MQRASQVWQDGSIGSDKLSQEEARAEVAEVYRCVQLDADDTTSRGQSWGEGIEDCRFRTSGGIIPLRREEELLRPIWP